MQRLVLACALACSLAVNGIPPAAVAGDPQVRAHVVVRDALARSGKPVRLEARLASEGLTGVTGLGGEQLEFLVSGTKAGTSLTGGDGVARLDYQTRLAGNHDILVRLVSSPRITAAHEGTAVLSVWEKRRPILLVELASLIEPEKSAVPVLPFPLPVGTLTEQKPVPDAADELKRLAQFYFNVLYVSTGHSGDPWGRTGDPRDWLKAHHFPPGHWLAVRDGREALGQAIDQLHAEGWDNLRSGIGRSKDFAEALLHHRIAVVMVPEPARGDLPKKVMMAKEWKEVRKHF